MSGQYPLHQAGGTPVTSNNITGWNPPHQQSQGLSVLPGISQSAVPGLPSQSHMHSLPGSPPKAMKFTNMPMNGSGGHLPANVANQSTSTLSENLRNSLQMYMNQGSGSTSKSPIVNSSVVTTTVPSGSIDLSGSSRDDDSKPVPSSSPQATQNRSVISSSVVAPLGNGDVQASAAVSVIANATSPRKEPNSTSQNSVTNANHTEFKPVSCVDSTVVIQETFVTKGSLSTDKVSQISNDIPEPQLKKIKVEDDVKNVNSSVIVGSSSSLCTQSYAVPQTNLHSSTIPSNHTTTVSNSSTKQDALDVESQLEALFAGIGDDGNSSKSLQPEPVSSSNLQGTPNVAAVLESKGSTGKKGKGKTNGLCGTSSTETTPKKKRKKRPVKPWEEDKKKKKKGGPSKSKYVKEASCDSGSNASSSRAKGPVVHIEGTRGAPTALSVVNAPSRQDDEDNDSKKKQLNSSRIGKIRPVEGKLSSSGLCGNSLVSRYEAHSSDPRWVCVFCKKGCHVDGLGDLFGPYLINHDTELENSLDLEADSDRKKDKKTKRSGIGQTGVYGLLAIPPLSGEQAQFMVYFHENCAVWSPSINLIGSRLAGVQEAVWVAVRSKCSSCLLDGANIGCLYHGCMMQVHYPCGREVGWHLDEETFISTCHIHRRLDQTSQLTKVPNL